MGSKKHNIPDCRYKEQYGVIVICKNEKEQKKIFAELQKKKYKVRVVVT